MSFRISNISEGWKRWFPGVASDRSTVSPVVMPSLEAPPADAAPTSYYSLMQRPRAHRLDICVNPESMPRITLTAKPASADYLPVKHRLVNDALERLRPYITFCMSVPGLANRAPAQAMLETLLRSFLVRYWDMPSSADNHHAYPWGHCLHSLDVACGEAELASVWTPMNTVGIDEIAQARFCSIMVLAAFAKGLVHDGHKIYQYKLQGLRGTTLEYFDPYLKDGTVLDFKLVHPNGLSWKWQSNIRMPGRRNLLEFFEITPKELLKSMGEEINSKIIGEICDMETCAADQESAMRDMHGKRGMETQAIIHAAILRYFKRSPGRALPDETIFYINDIWCAVIMPLFFRQLMPLQGFMDIQALCSYLLSENVLAADIVSGGPFIADVEFLLTKNKKCIRHKKTTLAFLRTSYIREAISLAIENLNTITFSVSDAGALNIVGNDLHTCFFTEWPADSFSEGNDSASEAKKTGKKNPTNTAPLVPTPKTSSSAAKISADRAVAPPSPSLKLTGLSCGSRFRLMAARTTEKDVGEEGWLACRQDAAFLRLPAFSRALCGLMGGADQSADTAFIEHLHEMLLSVGIVQPDTLESVECLIPGAVKGEWSPVKQQGIFWPLSPSAARQLAVMQLMGGRHAQTP